MNPTFPFVSRYVLFTCGHCNPEIFALCPQDNCPNPGTPTDTLCRAERANFPKTLGIRAKIDPKRMTSSPFKIGQAEVLILRTIEHQVTRDITHIIQESSKLALIPLTEPSFRVAVRRLKAARLIAGGSGQPRGVPGGQVYRLTRKGHNALKISLTAWQRLNRRFE